WALPADRRQEGPRGPAGAAHHGQTVAPALIRREEPEHSGREWTWHAVLVHSRPRWLSRYLRYVHNFGDHHEGLTVQWVVALLSETHVLRDDDQMLRALLGALQRLVPPLEPRLVLAELHTQGAQLTDGALLHLPVRPRDDHVVHVELVPGLGGGSVSGLQLPGQQLGRRLAVPRDGDLVALCVARRCRLDVLGRAGLALLGRRRRLGRGGGIGSRRQVRGLLARRGARRERRGDGRHGDDLASVAHD